MANSNTAEYIVWIDGALTEEESVAERYMRLEHNDPRELMYEDGPEHQEWLTEAAQACEELIAEYLHSFVHPAQLPSMLERKVLTGEYTAAELDAMALELIGRDSQKLKTL